MNSRPRTGEEGRPIPIRGERFFKLEHFWFFATREGASVGPYDSMDQAVQGVEDFIVFTHQASPKTLNIFLAGRQ